MSETKLPPKDLSAADIESADDLNPTPLEVPEWGGVVYLRTLPAAEYVELQDKLEAAKATAVDGNGKAKLGGSLDTTYLMLAPTLVDSKGKRLFADDAQARALLSKKNPTVLVRIQQAIGERVKAGAAAAKND